MRLDVIPTEAMTEAQRAVHDAVVSGKRGRMPPPALAWLHSPGLAMPAQAMGEHIRFGSSLPAKWNEMAILITARHWTSHFEWYAHRRIAEAAGLEVPIIEAIRDRRPPVLPDEGVQAIYDYVSALHRDRNVSQALHERMVAAWGAQGVVDLVGACGYYTFVSMTLNAFDIGLPEGEVSELV